MTGNLRQLFNYVNQPVNAAPLQVYRMVFGVMMFLSIVRFLLNGWVHALYVQPEFYFTFYGFEWVKPLSETGMYAIFIAMALLALLIASGWVYRISTFLFFVLFTYVELIDKSNYLNHYYFVSLISFILFLLPATGKLFAGSPQSLSIPRWAILAVQLQMAVVYFFAGTAKINADWLLNAMPLKIWLASKTHLPFIGPWLGETWVAYLFSWCGMLFDVCIAFILFNRRTVWLGYFFVIVFHSLTAILFPGIGMFPFIMMAGATIFLPAVFHERVLALFSRNSEVKAKPQLVKVRFAHIALSVLAIHFTIQILLPLRSHLYQGTLFYHEQGYRFSWRVMLMEKAGTVFFTIRTPDGALQEVNPSMHLTMQQEKQMSTQPDMILQFAHYLKQKYQATEVYAEAYVTVNGRGSRLLLDPAENLLDYKDGLQPKKWILAQAE